MIAGERERIRNCVHGNPFLKDSNAVAPLKGAVSCDPRLGNQLRAVTSSQTSPLRIGTGIGVITKARDYQAGDLRAGAGWRLKAYVAQRALMDGGGSAISNAAERAASRLHAMAWKDSCMAQAGDLAWLLQLPAARARAALAAP